MRLKSPNPGGKSKKNAQEPDRSARYPRKLYQMRPLLRTGARPSPQP